MQSMGCKNCARLTLKRHSSGRINKSKILITDDDATMQSVYSFFKHILKQCIRVEHLYSVDNWIYVMSVPSTIIKFSQRPIMYCASSMYCIAKK